MEVFTIAEHRGVEQQQQQRQRGLLPRRHRCSSCRINIPFGIVALLQFIIALCLSAMLIWNFVDASASTNILPIFGRLAVVFSFILTFFLQAAVYRGHAEIDDAKLVVNLGLYTTTFVVGITFWLIQMQYTSSLHVGVVNYTSMEPVVVTIGAMAGVYTLRRLMTHFDNCRSVELDIYSTPLFPQLLFAFSIGEALFGVAYAAAMNLVVSSEHEFSKRWGSIVGIFVSSVVNELGIMFCKESRSTLLVKTGGFFVLLIGTQMTWWLSYYKERQLTLYGLGVGFLSLLFGVLYTVEMSLQTAQLNSHNPDIQSGQRVANVLQIQQQRKSGDLKKGNNEEIDSASGSSTTSGDGSGMKILNKNCVIGFASFMQIGLSLLSIVVLAIDIFLPDEDNLRKQRIGNWFMWVVGFLSSLLLNELILFQDKVHYTLVSLCNGSFCTNFCIGCALTYKGIRAALEEQEAGSGEPFPLEYVVVGLFWIPYFLICHLDFVRLTRFSLTLEQARAASRQNHQRGRGRGRQPNVSLFLAGGVQSMIACAAFIPSTDFPYFPGKIFSLLTFPSLAFVSEVLFHYGNRCRGPFVVTFAAFFLGTAYSQLVWYVSVLLDDEQEFLGMGKPWLLLCGGIMGITAFTYVLRFLYVILTKWEKRE